MNRSTKRKIYGLAGIITGCVISTKTDSNLIELMAHGVTAAGAYQLGKENMRDVYRTATTYTRAGLSRLGIDYEER